MHGEIHGCTVLGEVHPVGAPNKTLLSDTVYILKSLKSRKSSKSRKSGISVIVGSISR